MTLTLAEALAARPNDHRSLRADFEKASGLSWHAPTPAALAAGHALSVVVPARNTAHSMRPVLDALATQNTHGSVEIIVVDDASTDSTADIAEAHPAVDMLIRLRDPGGAATARNVGTALASAGTIVYLDADMVIGPHVLADMAARSRPDTVLLGFRHNVRYTPGLDGSAQIPTRSPDLAADHRVTWRSNGGKQLYTGVVLDGPTTGRPLDETDDFQKLGHGVTYLDWDLPRTVVTALLAVPREKVVNVGGFDPTFGRIGWGMEDTHLGAALIASGCLVVPLRQCVGFHLDPPDADAQWETKLAGWPNTLAYYRMLLDGPVPSGRAGAFHAHTEQLLADAEVITR
ncbi:glycosyltransferase family 2 protein [Streptomyces colonosanans]|uniref:glycosyltransferase family 2 protein n=1 Tax=Streptomyces colonosanans TaxID=1428652 RepID=UPI001C4336C0|nr:glycosyltransferase family 2 protein [Streptomyces colonosanans]